MSEIEQEKTVETTQEEESKPKKEKKKIDSKSLIQEMVFNINQ